MRIIITVIVSMVWLVPFILNAQNSGDGSLKTVMDSAVARYPLLKARQFEIQAAKQQAATVSKVFAPELDAMYQANYASYNNITGMNYPQQLLPISGPPSAYNNFSGVFGSAASLLFKWQAVTFGRKNALNEEVQAGTQVAANRYQQDLLKLQVQVAHAYLEALAATALEGTFARNVERTEADLKALRGLVANGVKPGVDTALLAAEISKAKIGFYQARQMREQSHDLLKQLVVSDNLPVLSDTLLLKKRPVETPGTDTIAHPMLAYYDASIAVSRAQEKVLEKSAAPSIGLWGTTYARGSGIDDAGNVKSLDGLAFQRYNYGAGVQFVWPILQKSRIRPKLLQQEWMVKAQEAEKENAANELAMLSLREETRLVQAILVANETNLLLQSADYAYKAMHSRYESGLANLSEFLQAQYSLLKAETDTNLSTIEAWKAALELANARGSLQSFLAQIN